MAPNINDDHINYGAEVNEEKTKEAYWICLAFFFYDDPKEKNPTILENGWLQLLESVHLEVM